MTRTTCCLFAIALGISTLPAQALAHNQPANPGAGQPAPVAAPAPAAPAQPAPAAAPAVTPPVEAPVTTAPQTPAPHSPAAAAPAAHPGPATAAATPAGTVDEALAGGNLSVALERAQAARQANPSAHNWLVEASVLDRMRAYDGAIAAYQSYLQASEVGADPQQRAAVEDRIELLQEASRGAVATEPPSAHREDLDAQRAARNEPPPGPKPAPTPPPLADTDMRVASKWYFWVTLAAIVASAGVITVVAIKASSEEQDDALTRHGTVPPPTTPVLFRF